MYAQIEKKKENKIENKSSVIANPVAQKKSTVKKGFEITNNSGLLNNVVQMGGKGGKKKGKIIGVAGKHHIHVVGDNTHYKFGNDNGSRINIRDVSRQADLQTVINYLQPLAAQKGAQACIDWCNKQK